MRISKVNIKDFRVFDNITFDLGKNLTCIAGHNGVGKSTLLAILGNVGELKKEQGHHLNGTAFRGDFGQIIFGDREYDTTGDKCTITFDDLPTHPDLKDQFVKELDFRSTFQQRIIKNEKREKIICTVEGEEKELTVITSVENVSKNDRYRLIPKKKPERQTESKIPWPTYYLGLSRLYPVGEAKDITVSKTSKTPEDIKKEILRAHASILNSRYDEYLDASSIKIRDIDKSSFGIKTQSFSPKMNSSGLDNLGQILTSVFSFQVLKDSLKKKYCGGLLLIDEIDATLHPVAQNKLIDFLDKKSKELELQIVFTTHSISLLEHLVNKKRLKRDNGLEILYFTNKRSKLEVKKNPTIEYLKNDLMETYSGAHSARKVTVFTEDKTTRWFLKKILEYNNKTHLELNFLEMSVGWTEIIKLIKNDPTYYRNHLVVLDPDLNEDNNYKQLEGHLKGTPYKLNHNDGNIFTLPGKQYVEKTFWEFIDSLNPDDPFFYNETLDSMAITKDALKNKGPDSEEYSEYNKEDKKIKKWFEQNEWICDIAFDYWIVRDDNQQECARFFERLHTSYSKIYHRTR